MEVNRFKVSSSDTYVAYQSITEVQYLVNKYRLETLEDDLYVWDQLGENTYQAVPSVNGEIGICDTFWEFVPELISHLIINDMLVKQK